MKKLILLLPLLINTIIIKAQFGPQQIISTNADYAKSVFAADIDNDGDMDILSASQNDDKVAWYENLGGGNFGIQQVISTSSDGTRLVYVADLDGDGDGDIITGSYFDNKFCWHENLGGGLLAPNK